MKKRPFLLRRCDLAGCERQGAFELEDGRAICALHGLLFMAADHRIEETRPDLSDPDFDAKLHDV